MQSAATAKLFVGLDIGGTKIAVLVVDEHGLALGQAMQPTRSESPQDLLASITQAIHTALKEANATPLQIHSIGVGVPGQVVPASGFVQLAVNLNLASYPLGSAIAARFKAPTYLENDVRTAAIGAFHDLRRTEPVQQLAYVSIGTGIAAGIILNGRLYRGHHGMAGEIGHMIADPNGNLCKCGLRGCLETVVAGPAIMRQMMVAAPQSKLSIKSAGDVYQAAAAGDVVAEQVVQHVSWHLARTIQWLIMTYDVEKIVIGGGVSHSGTRFLAPILKELEQLRQQSTLAASLLLDEKLRLIPPEFNPGVWGAVQLARRLNDLVL